MNTAALRAREQRKADLVAAAALLRPHMAGAVHDLAGFADGTAQRVGQVRAWLADPWVRRIGVALAALAAARRLLRRRPPARHPHRAARWMAAMTLAWRLGRLTSPWLVAWLSRGR